MELTTLIKQYEGSNIIKGRHIPYQDTKGNLTIGYGRLLSRGISEREAEILLEADISLAKQNVYDVFGDLMTSSFTKNRYNALVDMIFNVGITKFRKFEKMIEAIKKGQWEEASRQALDSVWAAQVKSRAIEDALDLKNG